MKNPKILATQLGLGPLSLRLLMIKKLPKTLVIQLGIGLTECEATDDKKILSYRAWTKAH